MRMHYANPGITYRAETVSARGQSMHAHHQKLYQQLEAAQQSKINVIARFFGGEYW